jgi:3-methyladenine DNA glycosylase AlkC
MSQPLLKDGLNAASVKRIANALLDVAPDFPAKPFRQKALKGLDKLELKDRIYHIIEALHQTLPKDFKVSARLLTKLKKKWQTGNEDDRYGFAAWAITDYVGVHGIEHPKLALPLLQQLTSLFSAEFAIRPFIQRYPQQTWIHLHEWAEHENEHVRRLASEGCRPRLPWGTQLQELIADPMPIIALLDKLKDDSSEYVRRSVANNLNDISKDHPDLVVKICKRWQKGKSSEREWIIRHATRSLVKKGHPDVFSLLGYTDKPKIKLNSIELSTTQLKLGQTLEFSAVLDSTIKKSQKLVVDYAIHYMKANGKTSPKVYKLKNVALKANEKLLLQKKQPFKVISTRSFHEGEHSLELLVNGKPVGSKTFYLTV